MKQISPQDLLAPEIHFYREDIAPIILPTTAETILIEGKFENMTTIIDAIARSIQATILKSLLNIPTKLPRDTFISL